MHFVHRIPETTLKQVLGVPTERHYSSSAPGNVSARTYVPGGLEITDFSGSFHYETSLVPIFSGFYKKIGTLV